ncbi:MlaA family lipoprotein [Psychromonas sp. Urea-02u-13]|uniref:MlaA family lipoprotein n=1 Tax=Psychromonas sp. Urea-02u-13 TaxID=2058326 RepID=UPI000C3411DA|nr:VacJ family lipoprotein [Psychromonas sp. Urea-02u-13]PKG39884.1 ABC transporter [Psychromonas sp. Urea-02u-13]
MRKGVQLLWVCFINMPIIVSAQTVNGDYEHQTHMSDPIEPINRVIWDFNYLYLDAYIYKPTTETYVEWVPDGGRKAINNFVLNFEEPSTIINNLIQLELKHAADALLRFSVNSTFGLLGFFDLAEKGGVPRRRETFSNVLGRWYVPHGPYLMVPVLGPRSTRKLVGSFVDGLYFPMSYLSFWQSGTLWGLDGLDKRESVLGQEVLLEQALDPYIFAKEAYIQYEAFKFYQNSEDINLLMEEKEQQKSFEEQQDLDAFMDEID